MNHNKLRQEQYDIDRLVHALEYIALLANAKDPHLGHPRLSDKECIFCIAYFALNNGAFGYYISGEDFKNLAKKKREGVHNIEYGRDSMSDITKRIHNK